MFDPLDVKNGATGDVLVWSVLKNILLTIAEGPGTISFVWLAPPCSSFSALQNGHADGPWRTHEEPWGHGRTETVLGNKLWEVAVRIANAAVDKVCTFLSSIPSLHSPGSCRPPKNFLPDLGVSP